MNDLDRLRDDLHAEPSVPFGPPDLTAVMSTGRRIRRRRQLTIATATGAAVVALTGALFAIARPLAAPVVPPAAPATAAPSGLPSTPPTTPPPTTRFLATPPATPGLTEQTVPTGLMLYEGEFTLLVQPIDNPMQPDVRFGLMAAVTTASGEVKNLVSVSEGAGYDMTPGFHAGYRATLVRKNRVPQFGYYAGPATRIVGLTASGQTVEATTSLVDVLGEPVVLYWFDPAVAGEEPLSGMAAFDQAGLKLPTGDNHVGAG